MLCNLLWRRVSYVLWWTRTPGPPSWKSPRWETPPQVLTVWQCESSSQLTIWKRSLAAARPLFGSWAISLYLEDSWNSLLPERRQTRNSPFAYKPICLLAIASKLFERGQVDRVFGTVWDGLERGVFWGSAGVCARTRQRCTLRFYNSFLCDSLFI